MADLTDAFHLLDIPTDVYIEVGAGSTESFAHEAKANPDNFPQTPQRSAEEIFAAYEANKPAIMEAIGASFSANYLS